MAEARVVLFLDQTNNEQKEQEREAVNAFIRSGAFDGMIDFDGWCGTRPTRSTVQAKFDSGDHLHPNELCRDGRRRRSWDAGRGTALSQA
jgi:hypothetical protein